jgi:hypothetical protein
MKLTPWFSGDQKPVRVGVYERKHVWEVPVYAYWNGEWWGTGAFRKHRAVHKDYIGRPSMHQNLPWRGVMR